MESKTKSTVSENEIRQIVAKHFPLAKIESITELTEGLFNSAFLIEGSDAIAGGVVLKIGTHPNTKVLSNEKDIMRTEIAVYHLLEKTSVPTPKILAENLERDVISCDYFIMERLCGVTLKSVMDTLTEDERAFVLFELGKLTAQIHSVSSDYFGYVNREEHFRFSAFKDAFLCLLNGSLNDCKNFGFELCYDEIANTVAKYLPLLDEVKKAVLVDNDLYGNVFLNGEKTEVIGVIDFERATYSDKFVDFTSFSMLFNDVEKEKNFINGYVSVTNEPFVVTAKDKIRMNLYRLQKAVTGYAESYRYDGNFRAQVQGYMRMRIDKLLRDLA